MKKGISLIILGITIVVLSILSGIVVFSAKDAIEISKEGNFKTNMAKIQDAAVEYYAMRGVLPTQSDVEAITKTELLIKANVSSEEYSALSQAITSNGDDDSKFYAIDIGKLNIEKSVYDITKDSDVLYINDVGTHVYYIKGFKVGEYIFFTSDNR